MSRTGWAIGLGLGALLLAPPVTWAVDARAQEAFEERCRPVADVFRQLSGKGSGSVDDLTEAVVGSQRLLEAWARAASQIDDEFVLKYTECFTSKYTSTSRRTVALNLRPVAMCVAAGGYPCVFPAELQVGVYNPPQPRPTIPRGGSYVCNDGTVSFAENSQGACSSHGGIRY